MRKLGLLKEDQDQDDKVKVNYFEETDGGRLRRLDGQEQFTESLTDPGGEMAKSLEELEADFSGASNFARSLEEEEIDEQTVDQRAEVLRQQLETIRTTNTDPELASLLETLLKNVPTQSTQLAEPQKTAEPSSKSILVEEIPLGWGSMDYNRRIQHLNKRLQVAAAQLDAGELNSRGFDLWKSYSASRRVLAPTWKAVPEAAWDVLFDVFATESPTNRNRLDHIRTLAYDIDQAGVTMTGARQLLAIEAVFFSGSQTDALQSYRRRATTLGTNPETFMAYWHLGLRMYCHNGDLRRAEQLAGIILESPYEKEPRILFPLIKTYAVNPDTVEKAYDMYRGLKAATYNSMTIEDYDQIISFFLAANQTEKALWIFVDMMTSGSVDLRNMDKLPPSVANAFFVGKWLKRLIGAGDYDGAYNVLLHMKDKGVMPRPIQVNGLIGAWLRSKIGTNMEKAESTAWAMINSRIQFVQTRSRQQNDLDQHIILRQSGEGWPKATLETFSLLAESFKERGLPTKMEELWQAFSQAEMGPNAFLMNQVLFSLLQSGRGKEVMPLCRFLTQKYDIEPDSHTFMALWESLPINRLHRVESSELPNQIITSRELFAEMVRFVSTFAGEPFHYPLARVIMHTFRMHKDPVGMLVGYRALRQVFQLSNPGNMVLELLTDTLNIHKGTSNPRMRQKLLMGTRRIEQYLSQRRQELVRSGGLKKDQELPEEIRMAEMANFLEVHLETEISSIENVEQLFAEAAQQMGVYNPDAEDVD